MTKNPHLFKRAKTAIGSPKEAVLAVLGCIGFVGAAVSGITLYSIFVLMSVDFLEQQGILAEFEAGGIVWILQYVISYPAYVILLASFAALLQFVLPKLGFDVKSIYTREMWWVILGVAAIGAGMEATVFT